MTLNKIYNEDSMSGIKGIDNKSIDLILTDPPYGTTCCKWDQRVDTEEMMREYNRIIKDNGAIIITATQPFATELINADRKNFRYDLIWDKVLAVGHANCNRMPMRRHELILVFYKHLPTYNPQGLIEVEASRRKKVDNGRGVYAGMDKPYIKRFANYPKSILTYKKESKGINQTQKPLALWEYLIQTYSDPGDIVFDGFMGSGTTAVACINTGRNYIGYELDREQYEGAQRRVEKAEQGILF